MLQRSDAWEKLGWRVAQPQKSKLKKKFAGKSALAGL
jgi:hypothetical protein